MKSVKSTKTEVNLLTGFAGESQARNRIHISLRRPRMKVFVQIQLVFERPPTRKGTREAAFSSFWREGPAKISADIPGGHHRVRHGRISPRRPAAKTTNGRRCIRVRKSSARRRFRPRSRQSLSPSRWPRNSTQSDTRPLWRISTQAESSRRTSRSCGAV
jgi:hypothetical protein